MNTKDQTDRCTNRIIRRDCEVEGEDIEDCVYKKINDSSYNRDRIYKSRLMKNQTWHNSDKNIHTKSNEIFF